MQAESDSVETAHTQNMGVPRTWGRKRSWVKFVVGQTKMLNDSLQLARAGTEVKMRARLDLQPAVAADSVAGAVIVPALGVVGMRWHLHLAVARFQEDLRCYMAQVLQLAHAIQTVMTGSLWPAVAYCKAIVQEFVMAETKVEAIADEQPAVATCLGVEEPPGYIPDWLEPQNHPVLAERNHRSSQAGLKSCRHVRRGL